MKLITRLAAAIFLANLGKFNISLILILFCHFSPVYPSTQQLPNQLQAFKLERRKIEQELGKLEDVLPIIDDLHEIVGPKIRKGGEADAWADR